MIPLINKQTQIRFNYINKPLSETQIKQSQSQRPTSIRVQDAVRQSEQKIYKLQAFSSLQLQTRKQIPSQKKINQSQIQGLQGVQKTYSTALLETHQSLHKAEQLDPPVQNTYQKGAIPMLRAENVKNDAPRFKIQGIQQIRESDFFKDDGKGNNSSKGRQGNQPYDSNPYSNLYSRGGQSKLETHQQQNHHGKRILKQIKTFKIDKIEERKQSEFTGCCGFGITNKIAFLSKDD